MTSRHPSWLPAVALAHAIEPTSKLPSVGPNHLLLDLANLILGFLPLLAICLFIFGVIEWWSSAENEERSDQGKLMVTVAIIILIMTLLVWAVISYFITTTGGVMMDSNVSDL